MAIAPWFSTMATCSNPTVFSQTPPQLPKFLHCAADLWHLHGLRAIPTFWLKVPFGLLFGLTIGIMALIPFGGTVGIVLLLC